jgi:YD repeat-containing protein
MEFQLNYLLKTFRSGLTVTAIIVVAQTSPHVAFATTQTMCASMTLGPGIKSIRVTEGDVDRFTGSLHGTTRLHSTITVSQDRRTVDIVQFEVDTLTQVRKRMFPRTTLEYDAAGRMIRAIERIDGTRETGRTECEYDGLGRLRKAVRTAANPQFDQTQVVEYGPSWRRLRMTTNKMSVVITMDVDSSNRVVREMERDETTGALRMIRDYKYEPTTVEECLTEPAGQQICTVTRMDVHGNPVEVKAPEAYQTEAYEYDSRGNWIVRRTSGTGLMLGFAVLPVTFREITYWP